MSSATRVATVLAVVAGLIVVAASPALAETSLLVAAPTEATIGDTVPVTATVTEDGAPVPDAIVILSRKADFAGVSGYVELVRATTGEDGTVDLSYVQRAAEQTAELRVEVVDGDVESLDFTVTSVGPAQRVFEPHARLNLPGKAGLTLIALVGGIWLIILSTVLRLRSVAAADTEASGDVKPKRRMLPNVLSGTVAVLLIVLVTVLIRNPATHGTGPGDADRVPRSFVGEVVPFRGPGLEAIFADPTGDPLVDGARSLFGLGCASCHGLNATSGVVGGDMSDVVEDGLDEFLREVRRGPGGMPSYAEDAFSDEELAAVHSYLTTLLGE